MIHRRKGRKLKRTASHRKATLSNLSVSLIQNKRIRTTLAKAKELRMFIEPLITKSKRALASKDGKPEYGLHLRREANSFLQDKGAVKILFEEIASKVGDRPGGYTRVLKMGRRLGDAAELALIELVDYNTEQTVTEPADKAGETSASAKPKAKKTKGAASAKETSAKGKTKKSAKKVSPEKTEEKTTKTKKTKKTKEKAS
jgi:large subunit ribosomal protein L17